MLKNETRVLEKVSRGDLNQFVPVVTRDEFGLSAGHINNMIEGLRHRIKLIAALKLAEEVQRNLLPSEFPKIPKLDLAGTSIYCDETGGDYYDCLLLPGGRIGIVVADTSGHGIDAALFMATASELNGAGAVLGVTAEFQAQDFTLTAYCPGTVVLIGTDGIWEARNSSGELYGKPKLKELIQELNSQPAAVIQAAVIDSVQNFRAGASQEDDMAIVVVKLL